MSDSLTGLRFSCLRGGSYAATVLVRSGLSRLLARRRPSAACVLTFHGLRQVGEEDGILDHAMHLPVEDFRSYCVQLARSYQVVSMASVAAWQAGELELPERAVALSFDDGYESNALLGLPVLEELGLQATVYVTTGFLDGRHVPWFVRLEQALIETEVRELILAGRRWSLVDRSARLAAYREISGLYKTLPTTAAEHLVEEALDQLGRPRGELARPLRAMSWDQARALEASGWVEIGGHTHTHPILAQCSAEQLRREVGHCAERLRDELGARGRTFAYPNGQPGDTTPEVRRRVAEAGFAAGFNMTGGFIQQQDDPFDLHRYGNPRSAEDLEALASGSLHRYAALRSGWRRRA
jgi:peptidoglycan/xylan/chitin deacetylase (PgdA/CDA1 family)